MTELTAPARTQIQAHVRPRFMMSAFLRRNAVVPGLPLGLVAIIVFIALFAPLIAPGDPTKQSLLDSNIPPAWAGGDPDHFLGTDRFGRDQLTRLIHGTTISLAVSMVGILAGGGFGILIGLIAGYFGKTLDAVLMRLVDLFLAFPTLLFAIILATLLGPSFGNLILVVSVTMWPSFARLVRAETLGLRELDFVKYARASGVSPAVIILRHIFPNVVPTLLVLATWQVGHVILLESTLSFLGVGVPPPTPSWGSMVQDGRGQLASGWWISLFPGIAVTLSVLSWNVLGDWLRDWLDPKNRQL